MAGELKEFLSTLKQKLNIIEIAGNYISLERRGGNWWACCPFHHEKTPSFALNESDQFYHCFGCGESGDVIKFVQSMENIEFMDAVKMLAERVNLPMPQTAFDNGKTVELKRKKDVILQILNDCAHFYLANLNSGKADKFLEYIYRRQIPAGIVRTFGLGASLNFNDLPKYLLQKGYSRQDMLDSGAVSEVDGRLIDSQGDRLIFPIINAMNEVIAFGGRKLEKVDFGKYKNTRDTLVFNKSKSLYNVNLLKKLKKAQTISNVIMVEGYMDTISLYKAGFKNVVASMGTSLTQDQARLLKRYSDNVLVSYDGDAAGKKANDRGLDIFINNGLTVKVVPLTDGLDPDDVINKLGADEYRRRLDAAMPLIDYRLKSAAKSFDLAKSDDKRKYVAEAVKIIRTAASASEQEDLIKQLRDTTGLTYESLRRDVDSVPAEPAPAVKIAERKDNSSVWDRASRFVIAAYLFGSKITDGTEIENVAFVGEVHAIIARYVKAQKLLEEKIRPAELLELFDEGSEEYAEIIRIFDYSDGDRLRGEVAEKYFEDCVKTLNLYDIDRKIAELKKNIAVETDIVKRKKLTALLQSLIAERKKIRQ